jgi:tetratricopeptide (TPR) repeat protein
MRLALLPGDHPLIATSLVNLGLALLRDKQLEPARDAFQSAVDRRQKAGDELGAARAAVNLAVAQHALGDTGGGVRSLDNARKVFLQDLPPSHPVATTAAIDQAWLLLAMGEREKALSVARQAADALIAARALGGDEDEAMPVEADKRRIVVKVAAAWEVAAE